MKNLYFALLACLLTACFRAPHLTSLPPHTPAAAAIEVPAPLPPGREAYASASESAAAGTFTTEAGEAHTQPTTRPAYALASSEPSPAAIARSATRPVHLRRELRKAVRAVLLHERPAASTQDNPASQQSSLPAVALITGLVGILALLGSAVGAFAALGPVSGLLFALAFLSGLTAIILGGIAKGRIRRGKDAESGRGKATAGLILGIVDLSIILLLFALAIVIAIAWSNSTR